MMGPLGRSAEGRRRGVSGRFPSQNSTRRAPPTDSEGRLSPEGIRSATRWALLLAHPGRNTMILDGVTIECPGLAVPYLLEQSPGQPPALSGGHADVDAPRVRPLPVWMEGANRPGREKCPVPDDDAPEQE